MAGERYLGLSLDRGEHAEQLKTALGGLKGPLMKVAQILATIPDALPPEYAAQLSELQSNAPSMGWPFVRRRMLAELGPDWEAKFKTFEHVASRAASLGQVHKATGRDGRALACKLQYPEMESAVEADLDQLRLIFGLFKRWDGAIDHTEVQQELADRLREELDYRREAAHGRAYAAILKGEEGVHVPEVVPALSTGRLLISTWLEGEPLVEFAARDAKSRAAVARNMFQAWYLPFYRYGVIHGDPHLGNYSVRKDGAVNLFDFGCVRIFHPRFVQGVIDLYHALDTGDEELAAHAYETWGFKNISRDLLRVLNIWAEYLYRPLLEDKVQRIQESESGRYGASVAAKVHAELRRIGGVKPPREFVLMDRAAVGLGSVFLRLKAEVNWHRMLAGLIADFDQEALSRRQAKLLKSCGLPLPL
ncbi:MAG: AarF/ABC1/UbiB kinase family protein [Alphaproteobacteria bacterium]|nr:AarF/ABC1/UbiB kinase family protein [Alphaproteobacteria bacterium]